VLDVLLLLLLLWLLLIGIFTLSFSTLLRTVMYFVLVTLYGIVYSAGQQWVYSAVDEQLKALPGESANVVALVHNAAGEVQKMAKSLYPKGILDKAR
jgi:hypothetical protein